MRIVHKNLEKLYNLGLTKNSAIAELRKFQKSSKLRKFLNYLNLENFASQNLENFQHKPKDLENFRTSQDLKNFQMWLNLEKL